MPSPSHSIQSAEHNRGESQRRGCQIHSVSARDFVSPAPLFRFSFRAAIARESDREGEHQHQASKYRSVQSDGAAPKRSEAERKQARGLSQATSLASCVQVSPWSQASLAGFSQGISVWHKILGKLGNMAQIIIRKCPFSDILRHEGVWDYSTYYLRTNPTYYDDSM